MQPPDRTPHVVLSDEVFRLIFDASPVGVGLADEHGHFLAVNPSLCRLFGRPAEELIGHNSLAYTHPDDRKDHDKASDLVAAADDGIARVEKRYVRPDGEIRWAWLTFRHTIGPQGQTWTLAHVQDVTARVAAEQALRDSESNLRAVADVLSSIRSGDDVRPSIIRGAATMAGADLALLIERQRLQGGFTVTAATESSLVGRRLMQPSAVVDAWAHAGPITLDRHAIEEDRLSGVWPEPRPESALVVPIALNGDEVATLVVGWQHRPVTTPGSDQSLQLLADGTAVALHQAGLLAELETIANTDELSGLPNRRGWESRLPELMDLATVSLRELTVAVADLDHFKAFNDANGHLVGDALIRDFARTARRLLTKDGVIARWGGEEFIVALVHQPGTDALPVLERLRAAVPAGQTCSVGYALWDGVEDAHALVERADRALYHAKMVGRDRSERAG